MYLDSFSYEPTISQRFQFQQEKEKYLTEYGWNDKLVSSDSFFLYGKINTKGQVVAPKKEFLVERGKGKLFNFVAENFDRLKNYMNFSRLRGIVTDNNPNLYILEIQPSFIDVEQEYELYISNLFDILRNRIRNQTQILTDSNMIAKNVCNKKELLDFLKYDWILSGAVQQLPFSKYSYLLKNINSALSFGLVFEFDNAQYNDEIYKYEKYYNNQDFDVFVKSAFKFGFRVDRDIPWRLYVDLNSPEISKSYQTIFSQPIDTLFYRGYNVFRKCKKNHKNFLNFVKNLLKQDLTYSDINHLYELLIEKESH